MILTITSQYTLKILDYLYKESNQAINAKELSRNLDIPYKYLTKIMTKLTKEAIVESIQGRYGGFKIKEDSKFTIYDILKLNNEDIYQNCILGDKQCSENKKCKFHDSWKKTKDSLKKDFLDKTLLEMSNSD